MLYTLRELHELFIQENPTITISQSSFQDLRPANVLYKSSTPQNVCVCIYHENISLLLRAIDEQIYGLKSIDLNAFVKLLVCDDTQQTCMFSDCNQCSFNFRNKIEHKIIDPAHVIKWSLWTTSDEGRAVKCDYEGSVQNCVRVL